MPGVIERRQPPDVQRPRRGVGVGSRHEDVRARNAGALRDQTSRLIEHRRADVTGIHDGDGDLPPEGFDDGGADHERIVCPACLATAGDVAIEGNTRLRRDVPGGGTDGERRLGPAWDDEKEEQEGDARAHLEEACLMERGVNADFTH